MLAVRAHTGLESELHVSLSGAGKNDKWSAMWRKRATGVDGKRRAAHYGTLWRLLGRQVLSPKAHVTVNFFSRQNSERSSVRMRISGRSIIQNRMTRI